MQKLSKQDVVKEIAAETNLSAAAVTDVLDEFASLVGDELARGNKVSYPGLGIFSSSKRAARTATNPHTGEPVAVPAKTVAKFKPGADLARVVNGES